MPTMQLHAQNQNRELVGSIRWKLNVYVVEKKEVSLGPLMLSKPLDARGASYGFCFLFS